jgi:hypothetical protein
LENAPPSSAERSNIAEKDSKLYREVRAIFNPSVSTVIL